MELLLPPRSDGSRDKLDVQSQSFLIIGANGAGKSRFTRYLVEDLKGISFEVAAIPSIYDNSERETLPGSIDVLYNEASEVSPLMRGESEGRLQRLMALLIYEEVLNLISYKVHKGSNPDESPKQLPVTRLDKVISIWQELFPNNKVLLEGGKLLFTSGLDNKAYSSVRLSQGEKAVLYYIGAVLIAPENAVIFVDDPTALLHPSLAPQLWSRLEAERSDCKFVYTTHDLDFATTRSLSQILWVKNYDAASTTWDYSIVPSDTGLSDEIYLAVVGSRKPVIFIEGDDTHSIDSKLYPLIFPNHNVKALGSCNKVIEAVRAFNDLSSFHHLDSYGIVDRDRRDAGEVSYLRRKKILVPGVAEVENLLMLEEVIKTVAHRNGRNEQDVFSRVKRAIVSAFRNDLRAQALEHTRHRIKRTVEYRIDGRFNSITGLEEHMHNLVDNLNPRGLYEQMCQEFHGYLKAEDYSSILRVYNRKTMIHISNVAGLCGVKDGKDGYVNAIISILKANGKDATRIRNAMRQCFGLTPDDMNVVFNPLSEEE
jgi:hypothetical protein